MLRLFNIDKGRLKEQTPPENQLKQAVAKAAWIDAHDASDSERTQLQAFLRACFHEDLNLRS